MNEMVPTIHVIDPVEDSSWDLFVNGHRKGTIFHTSAWAVVVKKTYGYPPHYLVLKDSKNNIIGGIPFCIVNPPFSTSRLVSLPFTDGCLPMLDSKDHYQYILEYLSGLVENGKISTIEIRAGTDEFLSNSQFSRMNYYKLFNLELTSDIDHLWSRFKQKSVRYPIRKAKNLGIRIEKSISEDAMEIFYRLNIYTRKKHGVIPQPYKFFMNIQREFFKKNLGFLLIAWYKNNAVAGSIFFVFKDTVYYKFNASDVSYLKYQPNHLILWEAIRWAALNGYKTLDLGRTSPNNPGLMAFKRHWAAAEIDLPYYYWPEIKGTSAAKENDLKYRFATSLFRKTPVPVLRIAGDLFYRYFG